MLVDAFNILNLSQTRKQKYLDQQRIEMKHRLKGGKRMTVEEREQVRTDQLRRKDLSELQSCGDYERIFPLSDRSLRDQ